MVEARRASSKGGSRDPRGALGDGGSGAPRASRRGARGGRHVKEVGGSRLPLSMRRAPVAKPDGKRQTAVGSWRQGGQIDVVAIGVGNDEL